MCQCSTKLCFVQRVCIISQKVTLAMFILFCIVSFNVLVRSDSCVMKVPLNNFKSRLSFLSAAIQAPTCPNVRHNLNKYEFILFGYCDSKARKVLKFVCLFVCFESLI